MSARVGYTAERELTTLLLRIAPEHVASQRVAEACGFELTDEPIVVRERKGRSVRPATWRRTA
jgi:RimJ/RimL family protein N-acetyltransferase